MKRIREFDGLRGICALLVVIGHSIRNGFPETSFFYKFFSNTATMGSNFFFVLSGFLITQLFLEEVKLKGQISIKDFYIRRILRIVPAFYFYLMVVSFLVFFKIIDTSNYNIVQAALFFTNFQFSHIDWIVGHSWSLSAEEQFYLFFPFIFIVNHVMGRKVLLVFCLILYGLWGIFSFLHQENLATPWLYFIWIMFGVIISSYKDKLKYFSNLCPVTLAVVLGVFYFFWSEAIFQFPHQGIFYLIFSFVMFSILLIKTEEAYGLWKRFLLNKVIQWIGLCSFSLYLWQQIFTWHPSWIWTPIGLLISVTISYYVVERPCYQIGKVFIAKYA